MLDHRLLQCRNWLPLLAVLAVQVATSPGFSEDDDILGHPSSSNSDILHLWQATAPRQLENPHVPTHSAAGVASWQEVFQDPPLSPEAFAAPEAPGHTNDIPQEPTRSTLKRPRTPEQLYDLETASSSDTALVQKKAERAIREKFRRHFMIFKGKAELARAWAQNLRNALGRQDLGFRPADVNDVRKNRVFLGVGDDPIIDYHALTPITGVDRYTIMNQGQFAAIMEKVRQTNPELERRLPARQRIYMYLNSRRNLDDLNREYFRGHLKFLPIKTDELRRSELNHIYMGRKVQYLLPPRAQHELPLVVLRHIRSRKPGTWYISDLTGYSDEDGLLSLWSPVLFDGERETMVLYGIGQLVGHEKIKEVQDHIGRMAKETRQNPYGPVYHLPDLHP